MFTEAIKAEQERIQRFIDLSRTDTTGRGNLKLQKRGNKLYGYERWQGKGQAERLKYLGLLDSSAVRELFSVRFQAIRLGILEHDQKILERLKKQYRPYDFGAILSEMPRAYRIAARGNSFNQRYEEVREWANAEYNKNPYPEDGTRLRSKGECIFYNLLKGRGILFRYECEMVIVDQSGETKTLYPDFLIQCLDGTFIIIEHLGKIGNFRYSLDFGERCHWYFKEGFVLSKNFFVTSDDPHYGTDSQVIAGVVDQIERMFFGF